LVHKSPITREWISHPEDVLQETEFVIARIERVDSEKRQVELSMLGIPLDAEPAVASVYPDGPPWLPPIAEPAAHEPEPEAPTIAEPSTAPEPELEFEEPEPRPPIEAEAPPEAEPPGPKPVPPVIAEADELERFGLGGPGRAARSAVTLRGG